MTEPEVIQHFTHQFEFEGKTLDIELNTYASPFKKTMGGEVNLYTKVEVFLKDQPIPRWGHIYIADPINTHEQAAIIFKSIESNPMQYKEPEYKS